MTLHAVPPHADDEDDFKPAWMQEVDNGEYAEVRSELPTFEGEEVTFTKAKITSVPLDIGDRVLRMDESLKLVIEVRVISIDHKVNQTTGKLERIHTLKAINTLPIEWEMDMDALREALGE